MFRFKKYPFSQSELAQIEPVKPTTTNPLSGFYVQLPCNQLVKHEDELDVLSMQVSANVGKKKQEMLTYNCPACKSQHTSAVIG